MSERAGRPWSSTVPTCAPAPGATGDGEFLLAGLESFGGEDREAADAVILVAALEAGDHDRAARMALRHLDEVEAGLTHDMREEQDPLERLRRALLPDPATRKPRKTSRKDKGQETSPC